MFFYRGREGVSERKREVKTEKQSKERNGRKVKQTDVRFAILQCGKGSRDEEQYSEEDKKHYLCAHLKLPAESASLIDLSTLSRRVTSSLLLTQLTNAVVVQKPYLPKAAVRE